MKHIETKHMNALVNYAKRVDGFKFDKYTGKICYSPGDMPLRTFPDGYRHLVENFHPVYNTDNMYIGYCIDGEFKFKQRQWWE